MFMLPLFVMMWFLFIRPQRQRQKDAEALVKVLKVGDEVVTIGGIHGVITSIKEKTAVVRIADTVKVEFDRTAIASVVKKEEPAASQASPRPVSTQAASFSRRPVSFWEEV